MRAGERYTTLKTQLIKSGQIVKLKLLICLFFQI